MYSHKRWQRGKSPLHGVASAGFTGQSSHKESHQMLSPMNHKIVPCPEVTQSILQNWTNDISQTVPGKVIKGEMCELKDILGHREKNHILFWQMIVLH